MAKQMSQNQVLTTNWFMVIVEMIMSSVEMVRSSLELTCKAFCWLSYYG